MSTSLDDLYRSDYYAWSRQQADELRRLRIERSNTRLDFDNLAEEVESLGRSDLRRVKSQVRRIMEHLLKLHFSLAAEPRDGWLDSVLDARQDIEDYLTPAMWPEIEAGLPADYAKARTKAEQALQRHGEDEAASLLPVDLPYSMAELLDPGWLPTSVATISTINESP
jgi:hypothetical protein